MLFFLKNDILTFKKKKKIKMDDTEDNYENKGDEFIPRDKQKQKIHPYRKFQLIILSLFILMIILIINIFKLNKNLSKLTKENQTYSEQLFQLKEDNKYNKATYERVEVNYKGIYELDKQINTDIIKTLDEHYMLTEFINPDKSIQYNFCYKATLHGDNEKALRDYCSGIGPLLFLIETTDGYRFGAFFNLALNWDSETNGYLFDDNAFIFSFDTKKKYKVVNPDSALGDFKGQFPSIGKNDIFLADKFLSNRKSYTMFPNDFERDNSDFGDFILNGGMKKFQVKEMELASVYIRDEF